MTRVYFVTDIHGSNVCFRKFLNSARSSFRPDVMIVGADITGKYIVPIVERASGRWQARFQGKSIDLEGESALEGYQRMLGDAGAYGVVCGPDLASELARDPNRLDEVARAAKIERLAEWIDLADRRLDGLGKTVLINAGNDDPWYVDEVLDTSRTMTTAEGRAVALPEGLTIVSTGLANQTPWACPRDVPEPTLRTTIEAMLAKVDDPRRCVFNFHCPPHATMLDQAPRLDQRLRPVVGALGPELVSVGSTAVREAIERHQPVVSLHGHIHERFDHQKIGASECFNPGSEYGQGLLRGVFLEFDGPRLKNFGLTREG